ncbi:MAG: GntR family transcriptional regulator [Candidatus Cloacimonetes bacterium]|nr:GntR family transcriptional regulator [Candidatus Cloacimonadota bacterium]
MKFFDDQMPIYIQMRQEIEKAIIKGLIKEDEMIPSTRMLSQTYQINQKTAVNALSDLINEQILYKRRGIGIFVSPGSRKKLRERKKKEFREEDLISIIMTGKELGIKKEEILKTIETIYQQEGEEK